MPQTNSIQCEKSKEKCHSDEGLYDSSVKILGAAGATFLFPSRKKKVLSEKVKALFSYTKSSDNISEILYNL